MKPNQASPIARRALEFVIANAPEGVTGASVDPAGRHRPIPLCFNSPHGCHCSESDE